MREKGERVHGRASDSNGIGFNCILLAIIENIECIAHGKKCSEICILKNVTKMSKQSNCHLMI